MFCFNEFTFTIQVKHKMNSTHILGFILICLYFTTGHFHWKLDRRRSAKLTIPPSFDSRPLVYHNDRQALSTARFRRAGVLATADSCHN